MAFDSGDVAWVLTATLLVLMMLLPGLALFYGGLVRAKNLLSVMSQVMGVGAVAILAWVGWAYSLAFSGSGLIVGDFAKAGLAGMDGDTAWALATPGKAIPELLFACFQMSFAAITIALVVGALVERVRFSAMLLFSALFVTIVYAPIAHMVWTAAPCRATPHSPAAWPGRCSLPGWSCRRFVLCRWRCHARGGA